MAASNKQTKYRIAMLMAAILGAVRDSIFRPHRLAPPHRLDEKLPGRSSVPAPGTHHENCRGETIRSSTRSGTKALSDLFMAMLTAIFAAVMLLAAQLFTG
jgi:hypothetical protein